MIFMYCSLQAHKFPEVENEEAAIVAQKSGSTKKPISGSKDRLVFYIIRQGLVRQSFVAARRFISGISYNSIIA
jgi:hypothetical protein